MTAVATEFSYTESMSSTKTAQLSLVLGLLFALLLVLPGQVLALTIQLQEQGGATFYQDQVLGKGSDSAGSEVSETKESELEKSETKHDESETEVEKSEPKSTRLEATPEARPTATPKPILRNEQRKIEIKSSSDRKKLKVELKQGKKNQAATEKIETLETQRVNVKLPKSKLGDFMERELELHEDSQTENLNISSAGVTAKTKAEFLIDPVSKEVKVKTPSGLVHELQHLPDQAKQALLGHQTELTAAKKASDSPQDQSEIELTENKNGEVVYQATVTEPKRFLGLFSWQKSKTLELVDQTGEVRDVTATTATTTNPLNWLRERFSF